MNDPQNQPVREGDAGRIRCNHRGEGVEGRTERADACSQHDHRHAGQRIVAGTDHHRQDDRIEGEALLGHAVAGAAGREGGHEDRDHPDFAALKLLEQPSDAGVDRPGLGHDGEEAADDEHEDRDIHGIGHVGRRIVEPGDRRHEHGDESLRAGLDEGESAGDRRFACQGSG